MKNPQANVKRMTRRHFEKIYKTIYALSKAYHTDGAIPLITIKEVLDKARISNKNVTVAVYVTEHNKMIDILYDCCAVMAKDLNGKMPLIIFRSYIDKIKTSL